MACNLPIKSLLRVNICSSYRAKCCEFRGPGWFSLLFKNNRCHFVESGETSVFGNQRIANCTTTFQNWNITLLLLFYPLKVPGVYLQVIGGTYSLFEVLFVEVTSAPFFLSSKMFVSSLNEGNCGFSKYHHVFHRALIPSRIDCNSWIHIQFQKIPFLA